MSPTWSGRSADPRLVLSADDAEPAAPYAGRMARDAVRSLWNEPRVPNPPARTWLDVALVAVLVPAAVAEALFRPDLEWRPLALLLGAVPLFALLWRRSHPLAAVVIAFGAHAAIDVVPIVGHQHEATTLYVAAFVLLLPYSLLRWASGREAVIGIAFMFGSHLAIGPEEGVAPLEWIAALSILLLPAAFGATVRLHNAYNLRAIEGAKLRERELLARELHDTVAHHVSAIAIQAQAGRTVATADPDAAVAALKVIESEASRTLAEMRTMVGALRQGEEPALAPQPGVADLADLAGRATGSPVVEVDVTAGLDDLAPSVDAAVYRLAQESITNALRHARKPTRIRVAVTEEQDHVRVTVVDDGDGPVNGTTPGYGIVGMTERATLLGGTLQAGPNPDRGWTVTALLPLTAGPTGRVGGECR
jgi:signal transduction histidine kinase